MSLLDKNSLWKLSQSIRFVFLFILKRFHLEMFTKCFTFKKRIVICISSLSIWRCWSYDTDIHMTLFVYGTITHRTLLSRWHCYSLDTVHMTVIHMNRYLYNTVFHMTLLFIEHSYSYGTVIHGKLLYIWHCYSSDTVIHSTLLTIWH